MSKYEYIKPKSVYTKPEIDEIGVQLLDWMDEDHKNNWYIKEFLDLKIIPMGHIERFRKVSATFNDCWELAVQKMETTIAKQLVTKKGTPTGLIAVLRNQCGWKENEAKMTEVNIQRDELEEILKRKFPKRELFINSSGKLNEKISESEYEPLHQT